MSRRSSTNEERFLTLVQDFPKMAPPIYLSIYPFVSFDPCQVASSFERLISERNGSTTRMRKEGGEKERKERSRIPMKEERESRVQLTPGRIAIENLENVSELSEGKLARLSSPPNREEERLSPRLIAFSPCARRERHSRFPDNGQ